MKGSAFGMHESPRIFPIPLFDPDYYNLGKETGRVATLKVANWIGFFLESIQGNNIVGRITLARRRFLPAGIALPGP